MILYKNMNGYLPECFYLCILVKIKNKMKYTGIYILLTILSLLAACTGKLAEGKVVTVTIEPQRFFAEKIAGDKFAIHCVVPSGQSPETYDPTPRQMVQIGQSRRSARTIPI